MSLHRSRCAKIRISPLWIFSEREQWADQIATEHKRGIDCSQTTDVVLFLQQRKGEKEETQRGLESRVTLREIWICFFFLPPGVDCGTLVWDQRQCETCVLTSSKHVPLTLGSPSGVCYTAVCVCFQVAGLRLVVSSGFWVM